MATNQGTPEKITEVSVEQLLLDKDNARLASSLVNGGSQEDLLRVLWTEMAVDEVALSIAANGFYRYEPLLVTPATDGRAARKVMYVVVEGNRRLAAVLLLRDSALRQKLKATDLPRISPTEHEALDKLPVAIFPDRKSLWSYLGFRHVNGTKPWDAFSKAKYVAEVHESYSEDLAEIAKRIGDRHSTVLRLYRGYKVLRQAEQEAVFNREDRVRNRFYFSHLYTAVDQPEFQRFLGITQDRWTKPSPVPKSKFGELEELMTWLYGRRSTNTQPAVRTQNPDLNMLRNVISKPAALSLLRSRHSLDAAYETSIGDKRRFRDALTVSKEELQKAKSTVTTGYTGESDLMETADDIVALASTIRAEMKEISTRRSQPSSAVKAK